MHPAPLARLCHVLQAHVDQGVLPGAVALVHHQGRTVLHQAVGARRPGADAPAMAHDTLFASTR